MVPHLTVRHYVPQPIEQDLVPFSRKVLGVPLKLVTVVQPVFVGGSERSLQISQELIEIGHRRCPINADLLLVILNLTGMASCTGQAHPVLLPGLLPRRRVRDDESKGSVLPLSVHIRMVIRIRLFEQ